MSKAEAHAELCALLERRIGVQVKAPQGRDAVKGFVSGRVEALGLSSAWDYINLLASQQLQGEEFSRLIGAVTNRHTYFYRDAEQLQALGELMREMGRRKGRRLFIWSAGCSTGEEPYSIAMVAATLGLDVQILASDINREALDLAEGAQYRRWSLRHLPRGWSQRFFNSAKDSFFVSSAVRKRVEFRFHNLVGDSTPRPDTAVTSDWDVILCRNVFIYFDRSTIDRVASGFHRVIDDDGWLLLSVTESLHPYNTHFKPEQVGQSIAYRPEEELLAKTSEYVSVASLLPKPAPDSMRIVEHRSRQMAADARQEELYQRAVTAIDLGDPERAKADLEELLSEHPEHWVARVSQGNVFLREHAFEQALGAYRRAQEAAPLAAEPHYFMGLVYRKLGDFDRALGAFRRALFLQPDLWPANFLLAGTYARMNMRTQQLRCLSNALASLREGKRAPEFASHVTGMRDVVLPPEQVRSLCERELAAAGR